jgi:preprotein translocase subunit YajC
MNLQAFNPFDLLISPAFAQAAPGGAPAGSGLYNIVLPVIFIGVFYFIMIRPQMRRAKEQREMLGKLQKGDEVITSGGIAGRIDELGDHFVTVEVSDGVRIKFQKAAVSQVLPKGSLKAG